MNDSPRGEDRTPCPTCGTLVAADATRCPQCGRVFGEANRCPHCHAIAAVRRSGDGYRCVACSKPRELLEGTTVLDRDAPGDALDPGSLATSRSMRVAGSAMLALAALAVVSGLASWSGASALLLVLAALLAATGVGMLHRSGSVASRARARRHARYEARVLELAEKRHGDLLATDVAAALRIAVRDADAILTSMADGTRVTVEVDDHGIVHYVFREIALRSGPAVRVADGLDEQAARDAERAAIEEEARVRVERELGKRDRI